ncbi:MAG: 4-(cytidine 5'-diphospho)-2-C-methyl-D-erythritol kinase [Oscillospiraceae bacterium]|nr:4-(cytidine 5'-diphospho)-2-C-methyl-D-erythritol kinase [Oscillospiraceae bacterium]
MDTVYEKAYAKLNLSLDVLGRLPDGYHEMKMVMQSAGLWDDVTLRRNDSGQITLRSSFGFLPTDERNIAVRAARAFFDAAGQDMPGLSIRLDKRIPVGAGLGGGSSDAAAVLRGLNRMFGAPFGVRELEKLGDGLGSDVPFCVAGGTALATGRGEILEPLPPLPDCGIVICKPAFSIRTPDLFARIDSRRNRARPDTAGITAALAEGSAEGVARRMYNVFEDVLPARCGEIAVIRKRLLDAGALGAAMSGTGSAVLGLFRDMDEAEQARAKLKKSYAECFTAPPVGRLE